MTRGMFGLIGTLVLTGGVMACGGDGGTPPPENTTGTVIGSVQSQAEPVSGATVALSGVGSTTTNSQGNYTFNAVEAGTYTVTLTLPDGLELDNPSSAEQTVTVTAGGTASASWTLNDPAAPVIVTLSGVTFSPANLTISPGTTVRWVWESGSHTVTPDDATQNGVWNGTALLGSGSTFEHTFTEPSMSYDYHCEPHQNQGMVGNVTVTAN